MTKNSAAKAATRKLSAVRGVSYTTALRAQTDPSVSARTLGVGGAIIPTESRWNATGDGIATEVRIDLHAFAARRPSDQRAHAQSLAGTHLAVIRALLALSPNARMNLNEPEGAYKSRCRGFAEEDELPSMTHVIELPYLAGGSLWVYATIKGHRGRLTPFFSVDHDDEEALEPEAFQRFRKHSASILRHVRSTMGDSAQVNDARRSLREPRDSEQPRGVGEDVFFHEYREDA
jgi:hypothetical protein